MITIAQSTTTKAYIAYYPIPKTKQILCSPFSTTIGYAISHMTDTRNSGYVSHTTQIGEVAKTTIMDKYPEYFL